jgi:hypothetical protein
MQRLTKRQIDQFCRTVIRHLIDAYDTDAFCETPDITLEDSYAILDRMKWYARKFDTEHIKNVTTNSILNSVRNNEQI